MNPPPALLLDTNVWLDNYIGTRKDYEISRALIDRCRALEMPLLVAAISLKDIYFQIGAYLKREGRNDEGTLSEAVAKAAEEIAWNSTLNVTEIATIIPIDISDIALARYFHQIHPDLEDDLVIAATERADASYLVTKDKRLIAHAPTATLTPADMLTLLESLE